jgi:hypothetical protein
VIRLLLALGLAAVVPLIQNAIDARRGRFRSQEEILYVWSGKHVRTLSPGLENLLADIYWLRTVQYFGGQRAFATDKRYDLLGPLVEITTTLDPRFELAYRYGAVFLAEPYPTGAGQPHVAIELLRRGARANPGSWRLLQDEGFFHFFFLKDAREAARVLDEASRLPGAPFWLHTAAADFLAKGGEREISRRIWKRFYEQSDGIMRENAAFNLSRLDALDAVDAHQASVDEFERRTGRRPRSLEELGAAGLLRAPLVDPGRVPFEYDREKGTVSIARKSYLWRPPQ